AMDIAVELTHTASQVYLSIRREKLPWILPRFVNDIAYDHLPSRFSAYIIPPFIRGKIVENFIKSFPSPPPLMPTDSFIASLPTINFEIFQCLAVGTIIVKPNIKEFKSENNQIEFVDGTVLENIDVVIYAIVEQEFGKDFQHIVWLYKSMFSPKYPNIAFLGLALGAGAILPISEMQARYITSLVKGFIKPLPSQYEMEKSIRNFYENIHKNFCGSARSAIRLNYLSYMDTLSKEIGCYPHSYEIIKRFGFIFWKIIMFGVPTPIQYRLLGRNSWEGAKEAISLYNKNNYKTTAKMPKNRRDGQALVNISISTICKFAYKSWRYIDAYEKGLDSRTADWAINKYKSYYYLSGNIEKK
ncbi:15983_t:CDS:2, partial [Dentiscutata heterogama]